MNMKSANGLIPQTFMQNIGDAELASLRYEGEGPPLIFLHATGFLPWLWHPVARELAGDHRIFAPYFCAHRNSNPENGGVNWRTLAEDLALFCERLHLEKPFLVGHSMGATVAVIANALSGRRRRTPDSHGTAPRGDPSHPGFLPPPAAGGKNERRRFMKSDQQNPSQGGRR